MEKIQIPIGIIYSLKGATSLTEKGQCDATLLAIQELNQQSQHFELVPHIEDIASNPQMAVKHVERLLNRGVKLFVGTYTSACRKEIQPLLVKYDALLFYPAQYEGGEQHPNTIYCGAVPNQQLGEFLPWLIRKEGPRIFIVGSTYQYSRTLTSVATQLAQEYGAEIVGTHYIELGDEYFTPVFQAIEKTSPDFIFSTIVGESAIAFYNAYNTTGLGYSIGSTIMGEREMKEIETVASASFYSAFPYFSSIDSLINQHFLNKINTELSDTLVSSSIQTAYISVQLLGVALNKLEQYGQWDIKTIKQALQGVGMQVPEGYIEFDGDSQHLIHPMRIGEWDNREGFTIVYESNTSIVPLPFLFERNIEGLIQEVIHHVKEAIDNYSCPYILYDERGNIRHVTEKLCLDGNTLWNDLDIYKNTQLKGPVALHYLEERYILLPVYHEKQLLLIVCIKLPEATPSLLEPMLLTSLKQLLEQITDRVIKGKRQLMYLSILKEIGNQSDKGMLVLKDNKIIFSNRQAKQLRKAKGRAFDELLMSLALQSEGKVIHKFTTGEIYEIGIIRKGSLSYLYLKEVYSTLENKGIEEQVTFTQLIGQDKEFITMLADVKYLSNAEKNVIIRGEHGVGKEEIARAIHMGSTRKDQPFITLNCPMIAHQFFETELFGVEIMGEEKLQVSSILEEVNGGTLYLEEVTELPLYVQAMLVEVLQTKKFRKIGSQIDIPLDIQIVVSTKKEIEQEVAYNGSLHSDLYRMIKENELYVPKLNERNRDIPLLADYFLEILVRKKKCHKKTMTDEFIQALMSYPWPGNVQELKEVIERAFVLSEYEAVLSIEHLPNNILTHFMKNEYRNSKLLGSAGQMDRILHELIKNKGNISKTAQSLGLSRTTLYRKLEEYNKNHIYISSLYQ